MFHSQGCFYSTLISCIVNSVAEATRKRAFNLVAHAYSFISAEQFAQFIGLPTDKATEG